MAGVGEVVPAPQQEAKVATLRDSAIEVPTGTDTDWTGGVRFEAPACGRSASFNPCDNDVELLPGQDDPASGCGGEVDFAPFGILADDGPTSTFSRVGHDGRARATQQLELCTSARAEANLWHDEAGMGNVSLTSGLDGTDWADLFGDLSAAGAQTYAPDEALIRLIGEVSPCGCGHRKFIHASPRVVAAWMNATAPLIRKEGKVLLTFEDHVVVSGAGYPGTAPGGVVLDDAEYVYATGRVDLRFATPFPIGSDERETIDRRTNVSQWMMARYASVAWNPRCCWFGIAVDVPTETIS